MSQEAPITDTLGVVRQVAVPRGPLDINKEREYILFANALQMILADRSTIFEKPQSTFEERWDVWQERNSEKFRKVFEQLIIDDPEHFVNYSIIGNIPEAVLAEIEEKIKEH